MRTSTRRNNNAFTLVELLVVIGIIALLISILLPTLSKARETANRVKCMSNERQIAMACSMHATEHRGFFPFAGEIRNTAGTSDVPPTPQNMNDPALVRYTYMVGNTTYPQVIAPFPMALTRYLGGTSALNSATAAAELASPTGVSKIFACPSVQTPPMSYFIYDSGASGVNWAGILMPTCYQFNEAILGSFDNGADGYYAKRFLGNFAAVRQPSATALFIDGQPRNEAGNQIVAFYNIHPNSTDAWTTSLLYDAMTGVGMNPSGSGWAGGNATQFDPKRHNNMMNVAFVDGHAETVPMYRNPQLYRLLSVGSDLSTSLIPTDNTKRIYVFPPQ